MKITDFDTRLLGYIMQGVGIDRHTNQDVRKAFIVSVGRLALKHFRELDAVDPNIVVWDGKVFGIGGQDNPAHRRLTGDRYRAYQRANYYVRRYGSQIRHVVDWLTVAVRDDHAWLRNVDDRGRPKKLLKGGTIRDLFVEAEKQLARLAQQQAAQVDTTSALTSVDIKWTAALGDDLHLVQLLSAAAFDHESAVMGHCIGLGSYDARVEGDQRRYSFWSVRNSDGVALATLEVREGVVVQLAGRGNRHASRPVRQAVERYMETVGWTYTVNKEFDFEAWRERMNLQTDYWRLQRHLGRKPDLDDIRRFTALAVDDKRIIVARLHELAGFAPDVEIPRLHDPAVEVIYDGYDWVERYMDPGDDVYLPDEPPVPPGPR